MSWAIRLIYTAEEPDGREVVIDGQQRLTTFFSFIDGKFPKDETPFKLTSLRILGDLTGKTFKTLPDPVRRDFLKYTLSIIKIGAKSHPDIRFEIFERLNTGSVSLSEQELRNCLYRGPLNDLLRELSEYGAFRSCLGITRPMPRMKDVEMVLRFIAFYDQTYLNYSGRMKSFLNGFMQDRKNISTDKSQDYRIAFKLASDLAWSVFGEQAFRRYTVGHQGKRNGSWELSVNKALFDAVMWAFTRYEKRQILPVKDAIRERLIEIMTVDQEFVELVTLATADLPKIKLRFQRWHEAVDRIVTVPSSETRAFTYQHKLYLFTQDSTCKICSQRIESIDDAEVDHLVTFVDGGPTVANNARLSHRYCNRARRNTP